MDEELVRFLNIRTLGYKHNNYAFLNMDLEEIAKIKVILSHTKHTLITHYDNFSEALTKTSPFYAKNVVYDCLNDSLEELLDWESLINWSSISIEMFKIINILNFQNIKDIHILKRINDTIRNIPQYQMAFNIFTTDFKLKHYFDSNGKTLDYRDDMNFCDTKEKDYILG